MMMILTPRGRAANLVLHDVFTWGPSYMTCTMIGGLFWVDWFAGVTVSFGVVGFVILSKSFFGVRPGYVTMLPGICHKEGPLEFASEGSQT